MWRLTDVTSPMASAAEEPASLLVRKADRPAWTGVEDGLAPNGYFPLDTGRDCSLGH